MKKLDILNISAIISDSSGMFEEGELGNDVSEKSKKWLSEGNNRKNMIANLKYLAKQLESKKHPFEE